METQTMTSNEILKADMLDILFENRNKNYGAYPLRKFYNNRLSMALASSVSFIVLLLLICAPDGKLQATDANGFGDEVTLHTVAIPDPPKAPEVPKPAPHPAVAQVQDNNIHITSTAVTTTVPTQTDIGTAVIGNVSVAGTPAVVAPPAVENNTEIKASDAPTQPTVLASAAPEFPGGTAAWMAFLNRYLQAPSELQAGDKKTVYVKFLVGSDGSINSFEVIQSAGAAFDNEVIRVLKKMPRWKPAVQNGQNIAVTFTQPVTFMGEE